MITKHIKGKKTKLNRVFNSYFLPFSLNEKILLFVYLMIFCAYIFSIVLSKSYGLMIFFPVFILIILYSFYSRIFKRIKTVFRKRENISIIENIIKRQYIVSNSLEQEGLFSFELNYKNGIETMVIMCEDNNIYINSYFDRVFYSFKRRNLIQLERLINIHIAQAEKSLIVD